VAVGALVVEQDPGADVLVLGRLDHAGADRRVGAHPRPLGIGERARLRHHRFRQGHAADVVQDAREPHALDALWGQAELARGELCEAPDAPAVRGAAELAHVERLGEVQQRAQLHVRIAVAAARSVGEDAGHLGARDHGAVAAEALGGVESLVGGAQQGVRRLAVERVRGDPEADREGRVLLVGERLVDSGPNALGEHVGAVLVGVRRQHGELLPAHSRRSVEAALGAADCVGHAPEDGIAGGVPVGVVHALEAVEVADDQAEWLVGAAGALELEVEDLLEAAAVEQVGERVAVRGVAEAGDQAREAVARDGDEVAGYEQGCHGRDPAVEGLLARRLLDEDEGVPGGHQRDVEERRRAAEEIEDEQGDPDVRERPVRALRAPAVRGCGGQRRAE
jgi:hypothetical protein